MFITSLEYHFALSNKLMIVIQSVFNIHLTVHEYIDGIRHCLIQLYLINFFSALNYLK